MISVARGTGGAEIIKNLENISLLDIYQAVRCAQEDGQLFSFMIIRIQIVSWSPIFDGLDERIAKKSMKLWRKELSLTKSCSTGCECRLKNSNSNLKNKGH